MLLDLVGRRRDLARWNRHAFRRSSSFAWYS